MKEIRSGLAALALATCLTAAVSSPAAGAAPNGPATPDARSAPRGRDAIDALGDRLSRVARTYGLSAPELSALFLADRTLSVDRSGNLFYVDLAPAGLVGAPVATAGLDRLRVAPPTTDPVFHLHSRPAANHVIYLDFDGHTTTGTAWNSNYGTSTIVSPPYDLDNHPESWSATELFRIGEVWKIVAEDFAPFEIDVTTEQPPVGRLIKSGGGDTQWGVRVVITDDTFADCECGGHAYINSFNWNTDTPVFVYNSSLAGVSEASSHEVGHAVGLAHDGTSSATYYQGHGSGEASWAPLMGASYYESVTQWSKGEYRDANNNGANANYGRGPDDLAVITTYNGFGYRADDHGDTLAAATEVPGPTVAATGVIERTLDVDLFRLTSGGGPVQLLIAPAPVSPNLNVEATLRDSSGAPILVANPTSSLSATIDTTVAAGTYYLEVDGTGTGDPFANPPSGYTEYATLGQYTVTGTVTGDPGPNVPPVSGFSSNATGLSVAFTDTSTDADGVVVSWSWDFGDGGSSTLQHPVHAYGAAGTYGVSLTVTDDDGDSNTATGSVTLTDLPEAAGLYLSFRDSTTIGGVAVTDEDIVLWDGAGGYSLLFDGSDVGLSKLEIDGFDVLGPSQVLLSFTAKATLPGVGTVADTDIVLFAGTLGESTSGSFSLYFDGSDVGLDKGSEDVDGLVLLNDGSLLISTEGALSVPGLAAADEDVVRFAGSFGAATSGSFTMYFDGTDVGMDKDVDGLASDGVGLYFSSRDSFTAGGVTYRREDVALFRGTLGAATSGTLEMFWDGSAHGATKDVGGIDLP